MYFAMRFVICFLLPVIVSLLVLAYFPPVWQWKSSQVIFFYKAIKELNIKTKNWKELLTDEPFTKEDLITIQVSACLKLIQFFFFSLGYEIMSIVFSSLNITRMLMSIICRILMHLTARFCWILIM